MKRFLILLLIAQPVFAIDFNDPRTLIAAAVEQHPTLARLRAEAAAARERVTPAGALPNPMVMAGVRDKQIDLQNDEMMTMYMVGVSQVVTRPDKRDARREAAELEVRAAEKQIDAARAEIERDVFLAWYDLATADAQLRATEAVRETIDAVIAAARVRYEVGTSMQADVIRAQLEATDLERETLAMKGMRRAALARLLPDLGLPLDTTVPPVTLPELPAAVSSDDSEHPLVAMLQLEIALADEEIELAKLDARPDFEIEAQYGLRPEQTDMFSVIARVELPFRRNQTIEPRVREAIIRRDAARLRLDELRRSLARALAETAAAREEAMSQLELHREVLVPQAQLAFESTLTAYQTGKVAFDAVLATQTVYLRTRFQYFDFLGRAGRAAVSHDALLRGARPGEMQ
jgi:cobalt-zinc-cadmium efflux system outer membrane protein